MVFTYGAGADVGKKGFAEILGVHPLSAGADATGMSGGCRAGPLLDSGGAGCCWTIDSNGMLLGTNSGMMSTSVHRELEGGGGLLTDSADTTGVSIVVTGVMFSTLPVSLLSELIEMASDVLI